jgi:D-alanyl-D-alanine dipeptidase
LARADAFLQTSEDVRNALGFNCKIECRDCLRTLEMQEYAYSVYWPARLKAQDEEIAAMVSEYCAKPNTASPHISGGAVDVALINLEAKEYVNRASGKGYPPKANYPDYWENYDGEIDESIIDPAVVMMRRVLYHAMIEVAGLEINPTEIWHYSRGDKLWAYMASFVDRFTDNPAEIWSYGHHKYSVAAAYYQGAENIISVGDIVLNNFAVVKVESGDYALKCTVCEAEECRFSSFEDLVSYTPRDYMLCCGDADYRAMEGLPL